MEELMERFAEHPIVREELGSIEDYVAESENLLALDREIDNCDAILGGMEATLEEILGKVVDSVALSPAMVTGVMEQEVSEEYLGYLNALSRKIKSVATDQNLRGARALRDVEPELELLRVKAVSKAREFVAQRIYDLRRPKTNVQIQQQTRMLKFRHLVNFLRN